MAMTGFGDGAYGLGVLNQTKNNAWRGTGEAIGNAGWDEGGYSSVLAVLPKEGIVIAVMTNTAGDPKVLVFPVAEALAASARR